MKIRVTKKVCSFTMRLGWILMVLLTFQIPFRVTGTGQGLEQVGPMDKALYNKS